MLTGLIWSGPVAHYWYQLLEFAIDSVLKLPSAPVLQLIGRIALDAILFSPFTIAGFFAVSTLLERGTLGDVMDKLRTRWRRALVAAWSFWPVVNIVNFGIIPLAYRVLYANVMSLLWTGYLSYVNNLKQYKPTLTGKVS
jgi:protein Mpv17